MNYDEAAITVPAFLHDIVVHTGGRRTIRFANVGQEETLALTLSLSDELLHGVGRSIRTLSPRGFGD